MDNLKGELREIWVEMLKREDFSDEDDFYALGGTSFQAFTLLVKIKERFNVELKLIHLLQNVTVKYLVNLINTYRRDNE